MRRLSSGSWRIVLMFRDAMQPLRIFCLDVLRVGLRPFAIVIGLSCAATHAAVTLSWESITVQPGQTAVVGVFATSNSGESLAGFNLPFDLGANGMGLPMGFTLNPDLLRDKVWPTVNVNFMRNALVGIDGIVNGDGANILLGTAPLRLFSLAIDVSPTIESGTILPLAIRTSTAPINFFTLAGPSGALAASATAGQLMVSGALPGDYNRNGMVDQPDYALWREQFATTQVAGAGADGNASGFVDAADYTFWRDRAPSSSFARVVQAATTVPEPHAMLIAGVLGLGIARGVARSWAAAASN
jgi:hypothetical protein